MDAMNHRRAPFHLAVFLLLSILFLIPALLPAEEVFQEDFTAGLEAGLPRGWKLKQWFGKSHQVEIVSDDGAPAVRLVSDKNSFGLYREFATQAKSAPLLTWKWKVVRLPDGGDVRDKKKDDEAAQIYILFPRFPKMFNTRMLGYIWDSSAPKGSQVVSRKSSNTRYVVLESGKEHLGEWLKESRNIYDDYRALFGEEPPAVGGITLMIDSDDTGSSAESYFADIRLRKKE
ncbi:MAG: DUF3047 domain-containing protein [Nitrospirae bacterium]|nr:DUF3047 domain-containing protein [Candidatus Manganitrophaceae bacterium]